MSDIEQRQCVEVIASSGKRYIWEDGNTWGFSESRSDAIVCDSWDLSQQNISHLKNLVVIDSINAGRQLKTNAVFYEALLKPVLAFLNIEHVYWKTQNENSIKLFADKINEPRNVVFLSGDTSISEFINQLQRNGPLAFNVNIVPFPLGSGNAISNSVGIRTVFTGIKALLCGHRCHLPLYRVQLHGAKSKGNNVSTVYFLIVFSWCLHSTLIYESDKMKTRFGNERFKMAAQKILEKDPIFVTSDNQKLSYLLLTSLPNLEANFVISPDSKPDVDQLHSIIIPHMEPHKVMDIVLQGYNGGAHISDHSVQYKIVSSYPWKLQLNHSLKSDLCHVCIDGTILEMDPMSNSISIDIVEQNELFFWSV